MPLFHFEAIDKEGKTYKSVIDSGSIAEAKEELRKKGILIKKVYDSKPLLSRFKISPQNTSDLFLQLAQLLNAGFALYEALGALEEQFEGEKLHPIILALADHIHSGKSLSEALSIYPHCFDERICAMIGAGEAAGTLSTSLRQVAQLIARSEKVKKQLSTALIYPGLLLVFALLIICVMLGIVIPSMEPLLQDRSVNVLTQIVLFLSSLFRSGWIFLILSVVVGGAASLIYWLRKGGKPHLDRCILKIPIVRTIVMESSISKFSFTMSFLLNSGVPLVDSLELGSKVVSNGVLRNLLEKAQEKVIAGHYLSEELSKAPHIPKMVSRMIKVGEESGSLDQMFSHLAETYQQNLEKNLTRLTTLAQPLILVVIGLIVGIIMAAILIPLSDLSRISDF